MILCRQCFYDITFAITKTWFCPFSFPLLAFSIYSYRGIMATRKAVLSKYHTQILQVAEPQVSLKEKSMQCQRWDSFVLTSISQHIYQVWAGLFTLLWDSVERPLDITTFRVVKYIVCKPLLLIWKGSLDQPAQISPSHLRKTIISQPKSHPQNLFILCQTLPLLPRSTEPAVVLLNWKTRFPIQRIMPCSHYLEGF